MASNGLQRLGAQMGLVKRLVPRTGFEKQSTTKILGFRLVVAGMSPSK
jgi:hypothetical protein